MEMLKSVAMEATNAWVEDLGLDKYMPVQVYQIKGRTTNNGGS